MPSVALLGATGLVGRHTLDLLTRVRRIHRMKTAALIRCALVLGGLAGGARPAQLRRLEAAGEEAGLAFQIHDDLLNVGSTLARMGKRAGTDRRRGKATGGTA